MTYISFLNIMDLFLFKIILFGLTYNFLNVFFFFGSLGGGGGCIAPRTLKLSNVPTGP